jgi:hypothetical protein
LFWWNCFKYVFFFLVQVAAVCNDILIQTFSILGYFLLQQGIVTQSQFFGWLIRSIHGSANYDRY